MSLVRDFRPGLLPVRRGHEKSDAYSHSDSEDETSDIPKGAMIIGSSDGVGDPSYTIRGDVVTVLRKVTSIVNSVVDPLSNTFSGTVGLIQNKRDWFPALL